MRTTWQLEITSVTIPNGDRSRVQSEQFEADTIKEAKEKADDIITQNTSSLSGEVADFEWMLHKEKNRITKVYFPQRIRHVKGGIEIQHLPQVYVTIGPLGISLSEIRDYTETQQI